MPDARDTELLNHIRSYGQTPPPPPECQFNHWGLLSISRRNWLSNSNPQLTIRLSLSSWSRCCGIVGCSCPPIRAHGARTLKWSCRLSSGTF
jgi:hypothetical protein